jgi:hypothetical protein
MYMWLDWRQMATVELAPAAMALLAMSTGMTPRSAW